MKLPSHIPQLDVLRGLAVLYVMFYHLAKNVPALHLSQFFRFGFTGVDLFFVLSGFLITGILVRTRTNPDYFQNFYARRVLRIWPLYYALLLFVFILLPLAQPHLRAQIFQQSHPWQAFPLFLQNFLVKQEAFGALYITWSLAIEEQFYLVWPLIVRFAPLRLLKPIALCAPCISILLRFLVAHGSMHLNVTTNPFTRLDGLGLGAFLALWIPETTALRVKRTGLGALAASFPVVILVAWLRPLSSSFYTLVSLLFAALLCLTLNAPSLGNFRFLRFTGKISYGLYLLHVPAFDVARDPAFRGFYAFNSPFASDLVLAVLSIAAAFALAVASWYLLESPFLKWKSRFKLASASATPVRSAVSA